MWLTAANSSNTDTHSVEKYYCIRSISHGTENLTFDSAVLNGGVTAHVMRHGRPANGQSVSELDSELFTQGLGVLGKRR